MYSTLARPCFLALLILSASSASTAASSWKITEITASYLGTLGGNDSFAHDVNNHGAIVGWSRTAQGIEHAFVFRNGLMEDLGASLGTLRTRAHGINDKGETVGVLFTHDYEPVSTIQVYDSIALYWSADGVVQGLSEDFANSTAQPHSGIAYAINNQGSISGLLCCGQLGFVMASRWPQATGQPLLVDDRKYWSAVYDINSTTKMAGKYFDFGFLYGNAGPIQIPDPLLSAGAVSSRVALGLNDANHLVGYYNRFYQGETSRRAFVWDGASAQSQSLGLLPNARESVAYEINEQGFIAGWADKVRVPGSYRKVAMVWHESQPIITELPPPESIVPGIVPNCEARSINNRNRHGIVRLVGVCSLSGTQRAVKWDIKVVPVPDIVIGPAPTDPPDTVVSGM